MSVIPGILWLLALTAFGVIVYWALKNDAPGIGGGLGGLLAMKSDTDAENPEESEPAPRWRRKRSSLKAVRSRRARPGRRTV